MRAATQIRTADHLLPSTYEERGVAVPFTTPLLSFARLRKDYRDRLELSLGRFSDSEGYYVVLLDTVPQLTTLTAHDTMLQEQIIAGNAWDPFAARSASLNAAASGLAGTEIAEVANRTLASEQEAAGANRAALMLHALKECRGEIDPALLQKLGTRQGQDEIRAALEAQAEQLPMPLNRLMPKLAELAVATAAIGTASNPIEGRLRRLSRQLGELRMSLSEWAQERLSTAADDAKFIAEVAGMATISAGKLLGDFDRKMAAPVAIIMGGSKQITEIDSLARRLGFVLDGWEWIADRWLTGDAKAENDAINAIKEISAALPLPPREALDKNARQKLAGIMEYTRGWVRLNVDWATGEPDRNVIERLEARKKVP